MTWSTNKVTILRRDFSRFDRYCKFKTFLGHFEIGLFDECWLWVGSINDDGYGCFGCTLNGHQVYQAHVASYLFFVGSIPRKHNKKKLEVCHSCDNPSCVNPYHLWLGTHKQNIKDMDNKQRRSTSLSKDQVKKIRNLYATGKYTYYQLGEKFDVHSATIGYVLRQDTWKIN